MPKWWHGALREISKGVRPDMLRGPDGFWYRLVHDNEGRDKLEDKWPANTFVEILLWVIAIFSVLGFALDVFNNIRSVILGCP